jgi:protein TonB
LQLDLDGPGARRVFTGISVAGLHVLMVLVLIAQSATVRSMLPSMLHLKLVPGRFHVPPPPLQPLLLPPPPSAPMPNIVVAAPPAASAPRAAAQAPAVASHALHFGAASADTGLGLDVGTQAGGGAASRGSLADFEAAVKQKILAGKRQPGLAWDRRNTCVVNYTVNVSRAGAISGFTIAPCAVPEINQAARDAIQAAAPFPVPPDLGAATYAVHGTLIFRP